MRRTPQSLRRHLLLLLLTLLLTPLIPTLTVADSGDDAPLGPTQIAGDLPPPETDGTAVIQWGGGSLYQLTARLAVNGCDLNLLWVYDDQTQRYTAGYTFDGPSFLNATFERLYGKRIPPTTLWVKCIDMVQHVYGYALLSEEQQKEVDAVSKGQDRDLSIYYNLTDCGDYWRQATREHVLPILPILQNTCLVYLDPNEYAGGGVYESGLLFFWKSLNHYKRSSVFVTRYEDAIARLKVEFHELCHANQNWNTVKYAANSDFLASITTNDPSRVWHLSEQGREFIALAGFQKDEAGAWSLADDSIYDDSMNYTHGPKELSADVCAGYLMTKAQINQDWTDYYEPYLTDEAIDWLEKYVFVLPEARFEFPPDYLSGLVLNADGTGASGLYVKFCPQPIGECPKLRTDKDGAFSRRLPVGEYLLSLTRYGEDSLLDWIGYFYVDAPGHFTTDRAAATIINFTEDFPELRITLPADP